MDWLLNVANWVNDRVDALGLWLAEQDQTVQAISIGSVAVGLMVYGIEKGATWWEIRGSIDQSSAGKALKRQKLVEAIAWSVFGLLFAFAFLQTVGWLGQNVWRQNGIRLASAICVWGAVFVGGIFLRAFKRSQMVLGEHVDARQDAREVSQNERERFQDSRDVVSVIEPINARQDIREVEQNDREQYQDRRDQDLAT